MALDCPCPISKRKKACHKYRESSPQAPNPNRPNNNIDPSRDPIIERPYPVWRRVADQPIQANGSHTLVYGTQRPYDKIKEQRPPAMPLTVKAAKENEETPNQIDPSKP